MLERSDADRAALIGRLHVRDDAAWLAELLMDLEDEVGEIAGVRLVDGLRRTQKRDGVGVRPFSSGRHLGTLMHAELQSLGAPSAPHYPQQ